MLVFFSSIFYICPGLHECEVYGAHGPEAAESARTWAVCKKNPGHAGFIPYPELGLGDLPCRHQTRASLDRVRELAGRTVRLRVGYTSRDRPDGYAFSNVRGSDVVHTGSGWMDHVVFNPPSVSDSDADSEDIHRPCPCSECTKGVTPPCQAWYTVWVFTACHVVYNTEEARATQVDFFYDDERAAQDGNVKTVWGYDVSFRDPVRDVCVLACATHDKSLADRLDALCLFSRTSKKPSFISQHLKLDFGSVPDCVIVSHPHGQPKQVTIGEILQVENTGTWEVLAYSASTCAGSSGAAVLLLGSDDVDVTFYPHLHSRGGDLNHASAFYYRPLHHRSKLYRRLQDT